MSDAKSLSSEIGYGFGFSYMTEIGYEGSTIFNLALEYTSRRVSEDLDEIYSGLKIDYSFNYITVRPLFLIPISELSFIILGGNIGFESGSEVTASLGNESESTDIDDGLNTVRFGLEAGLSFNIERAHISISYDLGLNPTLDLADSDSKLSSLNLALTFML